jgi:hypothetical protein
LSWQQVDEAGSKVVGQLVMPLMAVDINIDGLADLVKAYISTIYALRIHVPLHRQYAESLNDASSRDTNGCQSMATGNVVEEGSLIPL